MRVFYDPRQTAPRQSWSPSAAKPALVLESWRALGVPLEVVKPDPASVDQLALAHDRAYVEGVLSGRRQNGFGTSDPAVAASLPWTAGSMVSAARDAVRSQGVAVSPTSGFHHAGWADGGGFCTFNGLMVAARVLLESGLARRVGILDLDMHYGDGTEDIIGHLRLEDVVVNATAGRHFDDGADADEFLAWVEASIADLRGRHRADVILAQLGADPHIEDPLGGYLDDAAMRRRDALVFERCHALGIPLAWNLAGGYQVEAGGSIGPVLRLHDASAEECARIYDGWRRPDGIK